MKNLMTLFKDNAFEWIFIEGKMYLKDNFFENLIKVRNAYKDRLIEKRWRCKYFIR